MDDMRGMPDLFEKPQQIDGRNRGRAVVTERMAIDEIGIEHTLLENHLHAGLGVVDDRERRNRAGNDTEEPVQIRLAGKREASSLANEKRGACKSVAATRRSTRVCSSATSSQYPPFLSLRNRFLA